VAEVTRIGEFTMQWGESLRWDDRRRRLYFVDCATQNLHWLEGTSPPVHSLKLPSMPTGVVLTDDDRLVIALEGGLHIVDTDAGDVQLLAPYPDALGERANDAAADLDGNLVTGTLNLVEAPGSYWWFSARDGWRQLDEGISNANGPVVLEVDGRSLLVFADTPAARLYAYRYDGRSGTATERRVFADTSQRHGHPDGACADDGGGVWCCILGAGEIVRYTNAGLTDAIETGVELPSDVTFGGEELDRMFFVSIAVSLGDVEIKSPNAGALMVVDGSGYHGRREPRMRL
jgi:sugar lactone lactonase YvrE